MTKPFPAKVFFGIAIVVILAAIPFLLGKYFELNFPDPYDSGGYVYSAKHILEGAQLGVDENPSARVGTLLINMLGVWFFGFNEIGPKLIQAILQAAALIMMFISMRKLFGMLAAAVGVIIASVYLSAPLIAKFGNVKEQYMIAFMVLGVSCFILRQLDGKWFWAVLAGAFLAWAPLFKETGTSAIGAVGLFVIVQLLLKHRTPKQTGIDIALLLAGAIASLTPIYIWLATTKAPANYWPYFFAWNILSNIGSQEAGGSYISTAREMNAFSDQWPRVLRYYGLLCLPIAMAAGSIILAIVRMISMLLSKSKEGIKAGGYDRFVLLLAVWWLLDMAFVWISPRSYEQYYLPLNASAAMLAGYLIAVYRDKLAGTVFKGKWVVVGVAGFAAMVIMSWHIFFGIKTSPHSGTKYQRPTRGYAPKFKEISLRRREGRKTFSEAAGEYIRAHSEPTDKIYVWGWIPGIYVAAQRFSPSANAFTSEMHVVTPQVLSEMATELLTAFEKEKPLFIVDTHKRHFPWDRPPLELWPRTQKGFLPPNENVIASYENAYENMLREKINADEAERFKAMKPLRDFVMNNYKITRAFGDHIVFELKKGKQTK